jgi:SAM-dependent methyltransferase
MGFVGEDFKKATSFGTVAADYDRVRPGPASGALGFLIPNGCSLAVDLAAGTGLFTRPLARLVPEVVAVEPDPRMREVLAASTPSVTVLDGRGEAIPLPDSSADAVFVATAWHWLDPAVAVPEIARVLRDGGRLGVVWTSRDRAEDWVAELDLLRMPRRGAGAGGGARAGTDTDCGTDAGRGGARTVEGVREEVGRGHAVALPEGAPFGNVQTESFGYTRTMLVDELVGWLATNSALITAAPGEREAGLARCRAALARRADDRSRIEVPIRSWCWRADRLPK